MWSTAALVAVLILILLVVTRFIRALDDRHARSVLVTFLDGLIDRAKGEGEPLHDLHRTDHADDAGHLVGREWTVYTTDDRWVTIGWRRCGWRGKRLRYKLSGRLPDGYIAFPTGDRRCEAFWFVGRMRVLEAVLGGYPRERLVAERERREFEAFLAECDAELAEIEASLANAEDDDPPPAA